MMRYLCRLVVAVVALTMVAVPAEAVKKKKKVEVSADRMFEPDPVPTGSKARPDMPMTSVTKPRKFGGVSGSSGAGHLHGIDVSHYQGVINWSEVAKDKEAGFVYVKATEGKEYVDDRYQVNFTEARRQGLKTGSYHFFRPAVDAETQYKNFMGVINVQQQDLLPLVDVETISGAKSIAAFHRNLLLFCRLVTHAFNGKKPMIYTGKNFYNKYFAGYEDFKQYKFMIASYVGDEPELDYGGDYLIWQYTGKGSMRGIKGHVDRSRFRGGHGLGEILAK